MSALTDECKGEPCYIRLPLPCLPGIETVVPCHFPLMGYHGTALKSPDVLVCPGCFNCHDAVDRRRFKDLDRDYVRQAHAEGVMRWIVELVRRGRIKT